MPFRHLHTRFILAGCLIVTTTVVSGLWSAWTFARLSAVVNETVHESQETIDLTTAVAGSLEREDDALLLALSDRVAEAEQQVANERAVGDKRSQRLIDILANGNVRERVLASTLSRQIGEYREAGSALVTSAAEPKALKRYHDEVNPLLRKAVATCAQVREVNFRQMRDAGVRARDEASRATRIVIGVSLMAILLATVVAVWLARAVVVPVRELTDSVEAIRAGDFDRRIPLTSPDELGHLAAGFNRLAETLAEYRRSSLGELLAAKTTLEATLNALPDAVLVFGPDGTLVALNPPAETLLAAKCACGQSRLADLPFSDIQRAAIEAALAGKMASPRSPDFRETVNAVLGDRPRRFLLTAVPIPEFLPGRFGAVAVLDDVTEFARLDELRSELVGVASHELNSPLTTLRMNLLMLGENSAEMPARQRELIAAAILGCEELGSTIEELLDVTRIEAGQLRLHLAPVDLGAVLATVRAGLQVRFDDAGVWLEVRCDATPSVVLGDAARLGSVFANVLSNALKYSPASGVVTVRVSSGQNAEEGGAPSLRITVTDQGPGVPAEFRERVFEKFFRVEHQLGHSGEGVRGTGIGLYLCREIIRAHGGSITCHSADDNIGTRIAITLPIGK
jgi:NtrC-family two-component system sensor histidine kinase KinB